jgi:hypothetical protein
VTVSIIILALVLAAFACLAGTSVQTWTDPALLTTVTPRRSVLGREFLGVSAS